MSYFIFLLKWTLRIYNVTPIGRFGQSAAVIGCCCLKELQTLPVINVVVFGAIMASHCSLVTLFPIQSQLDYALDDATTQQEKEDLIYQYLKKIDEREDLKIPDFQPG